MNRQTPTDRPIAEPEANDRPPVRPQQLATPEYDEEAERRTNATTRKMKQRIRDFFGNINGKWDKSSSSDMDDDIEI